MSELPGGLDAAPRADQARGDQDGCPVRIFPLRRPQGHKPPIGGRIEDSVPKDSTAEEHGCDPLRPGDELAEAYSLGAFVSLAHLESWAKDHPSHLAIYTRAMAARRKYQDQLQLRTYNEIFIVEANNPPFNCHSRTGLLPYAQMLVSAGA